MVKHTLNLDNSFIYPHLDTNYNFLFIIMIILVKNNFLFCKPIFKLVIIMIHNFWLLKFVVINEAFSCRNNSSLPFRICNGDCIELCLLM